jgi:hypothetical protein
MVVVRRAIPPGVAVLILALTGCGGDPYAGRMEVSGSATLKGQPLPDGAIIQFEPLESQGTAGTAMFTAGAYSLPRQNGLKAGKYLVRLSAGDGKTAVNPVNPDEPPGPAMKGSTNIVSKDLIPADWGSKSKQEVTVTAAGPNKFDFVIP